MHAEVSQGSLGFTWVYSGAPKGRRVHSDSRGFTRTLLKAAGLILGSVGSLGRSRCRRVHWG